VKTESRSPAASPRSAGPYWVQVGAFRDSSAAAALAEKLRTEKFRVQELSVGRGQTESPPPHRGDVSAGVSTRGREIAEKYEVFVSRLSPADLTAKVASRGMSASAAVGGAVVRPSQALRDAVALSRDLAGEGLTVQVRRVLGNAPTDGRAPAPDRAAPAVAGSAPAIAGAGETLYRVRVGSFPDRAAAEEARRELAARGYAGFLTREGG
jgi:SPOR domain